MNHCVSPTICRCPTETTDNLCRITWDDLEETIESDVRYCAVCGERFFLCRNSEEFEIHIKNKRRVAVPLKTPPSENDQRMALIKGMTDPIPMRLTREARAQFKRWWVENVSS